MEGLLIYISTYSSLIPLLIIFKYLRFFSKIDLLYVALVLSSFISDFLCLHLFSKAGSTYHIINIYLIIEISLLGLIFSNQRTPWRNGTKVVFCILLGCLVFQFLDDGLFNYFSDFLSIYSLVIICLCLLQYFWIYKTCTLEFIDQVSIFWYNSVLFFFFGGSLFTDVLSSSILNGPLQWSFLQFANILKNILITIGIWKIPRHT